MNSMTQNRKPNKTRDKRPNHTQKKKNLLDNNTSLI